MLGDFIRESFGRNLAEEAVPVSYTHLLGSVVKVCTTLRTGPHLISLSSMAKNTFIFAVIGIVLTPLPMFFAILLNEIKCGPVRRAVSYTHLDVYKRQVCDSSRLHGMG